VRTPSAATAIQFHHEEHEEHEEHEVLKKHLVCFFLRALRVLRGERVFLEMSESGILQ
jgi:hypothetical protein